MSESVEMHPFGYEYEVLYSNVIKLFGFDDRIVLQADHDGDFIVIEDFGALADYNDPEFQDVMDEQVAVRTFATIDEREQYLERNYVAKRPWLRERIDEARRSFGRGRSW